MRQLRRFSIFVAAVLAAGQTAAPSRSGPASISGAVADPQGKAVSGAAVDLFSRDGGPSASTSTNPAGQYRFDGLAAGDYIIQVQAPGFARFTAAAANLTAGSLVRDINLQIAAPDQQVVVTASGTPLTADEISKAVSIVDHAEIEQRDDTLLADALRATPGLRVQQLGGAGGLTTLKFRGLRNEDTAVLFDGMRFRDVTTPQGDASSFIQDFIDTDLDRIEVLRGTGSSLYGTDAIGGVVNLISNQGGGRTRGSILTEGGELGTFRGKADLEGALLHQRLSYSAGFTHLNVTSGIGGAAPARITSGQGSLACQLTPQLQLTARLYAADSYSRQFGEPGAIGLLPANGIIDAIPAAPAVLDAYAAGTPASTLNPGSSNFLPALPDPDSSRAGRFLAGAATLLGHPSSGATYSVSYQGVSTWSDFANGPAGPGYQPVGGNTSSISGGLDQILSAQAGFRLSHAQLLNGGFEFDQEDYSLRSLQPANLGNSSVSASQHSEAFWLQDQLRLFDGRLLFAASGRIQIFQLGQPSFLPSSSAPYAGIAPVAPPNAYTGDASIAWFFRRTNTKIRAHAGRGYRAPSLYERFGSYFDPVFGYSVYGDPRLTPEHSTAFDAGLDQDFWASRVRLSATYFYTRLENEIFFDDYTGLINPATDPFGRFAGYYNSRGGLARGVETSLVAAPTSSMDVTAAYTFTDSLQKSPVVEDIFQTFAVPAHQFSVVLTQRIGPRFYLNFDLAASSSYLAPITALATFSTRPFRFPGMRNASVGASYRLPLSEYRALRFFSRVTNLFNQSYYEAGFPTAGIGALGGVQFEF